MGFIKPNVPVADYLEWSSMPRMERIKVLAQAWAERGFGTPDAVLLLYVVKFSLYAVVGLWITSLTPGIGGLADIGKWWTEPIVFEKLIIFTLLVEVVGLGGACGPLTMRFLPPVGAPFYWLRPGTIRQPPWPRIPLTAGDKRSLVDVGLYAGLIGCAVWLLLSPGDSGNLAGSVGVLQPWRVAILLAVLIVLGLRDKAIFLAARGEVYGTLALTFVFFSGADTIVAAKLVFLTIWWGAATSKLNKHFPFVISAMLSNNPIVRARALKRRLFRAWPDDIRPSRMSNVIAHFATAVEYLVPLILLLSRGGVVTIVAAIVMIMFHLAILTSLPMAVPLEWNVFMMFGTAFLFVHNAHYGFGDLQNPIGVATLILLVVTIVVLGNVFPAKVSFLPAMRYYAGNWAASLWCMTDSALTKFENDVTKSSALPRKQIERIYDAQTADVIEHQIYAFRSMHTHGRALFTLVPRATGPDHEAHYRVVDGELLCGTAIGWNFGDGHLHNEQLLAALQKRCRFAPGEVRVVVLESQPFARPRQEYRLIDAATGEFERGHVDVVDMVDRQPWDASVPLHISQRSGALSGKRIQSRL